MRCAITHPLRKTGSLALAARRAAVSFGRRHARKVVRPRPAAWPRIALRWARRNKPARHSGPPRGVFASYQSRIQLNLAITTLYQGASPVERREAAAVLVSAASTRSSARDALVSRPHGWPGRLSLLFAKPAWSGSLPERTAGMPGPTRAKRAGSPSQASSRIAAQGYPPRLANDPGADGSAISRRWRWRALARSASSSSVIAAGGEREEAVRAGRRHRQYFAPQWFARLPVSKPGMMRHSQSPATMTNSRTMAICRKRAMEFPAASRPSTRLAARPDFDGRADTYGLAPARQSSRLSGRAAVLLANRQPVDLVWRSVEDRSAPTGEAARGMSQIRQAPPGRPLTAAAPPSSSRAGQEQHFAHANALDPALVNRLADDVIRRIDRRTRLERERRGLA